MNEKPNDTPPQKPEMTVLEADRREAIARHHGAEAARVQGGDPAVISALMTTENGHPKVGGVVILGVHGNSFTAACIVAMELWESRRLGPNMGMLTMPERAVALYLIQKDPKTAWQAMLPEDAKPFLEMIRHEIFEAGVTMDQLNQVNRAIAQVTASSQREEAPEDDAVFRKPAEPATSSPT